MTQGFARNWLMSCSVLVFCTVFLLCQCGSSEPKKPKINSAMSLTSYADKIVFLASDYRSSSSVYSYDLDAKTTKTELDLQPGSQDAKLYQGLSDPIRLTSNGDELFLVERFAGKTPSRLTVLQHGTISEIKGLAANVQNLMKFSGGKFLATGWNFGELSRFLLPEIRETNSQAGTKNFQATTSPLTGLSAKDRAIGPILVDNNGRAWVLSVGIENQVVPVSAKLHRLVETSIAETIVLPECINAAESVSLSAGHIILSCNPQYSGARAGQTLSLVSVDVTSGVLRTQVLRTWPAADVQIVALGGAVVTSAGPQLFLEEQKVDAVDRLGRVTKRYLFTLDGKENALPGVGGKVTMTRQGAVFSCRLSASGQCEVGVFGKIASADLTSVQPLVSALPYQTSTPFRSFSEPLFVAP